MKQNQTLGEEIFVFDKEGKSVYVFNTLSQAYKKHTVHYESSEKKGSIVKEKMSE